MKTKNVTVADEVRSPEIEVKDSASTPAKLINKLYAIAGKLYWGEKRIDVQAAEQVNSDWNATSGKAEILHKPTIPTMPDISGKVDKVSGSSLVPDTEISKIHAPGSDNQDLSGLVVKVSGSSLVPDTEISKIHAPGSDNQDLSGLVVKVSGSSLVPDTEISKIHAPGSDNQDLSGLVVKVSGSSLVPDTEISKIHAPGSDNQDLSGLVVKVSGSSLVPDTEISKIHAPGSDNQDLSGYASKPTLLTSQTLLAANWSLNAGFYEYTFSNVNITAKSFVMVVPQNSAFAYLQACNIVPYILTSAGSAKFYAAIPPAANIVVDILITETP